MFARITSLITKFIWNKKCPRVCQSLLYLPCDKWGLKCPNLHWYYLAAQLKTFMFYFSREDIQPSWLNIESYAIPIQLPLHLYLYSANLKYLRAHTAHPIMLNIVIIWYEAMAHLDQASWMLVK